MEDLKLRKIKLNGKYGFEDSEGNIVVPCKYDNAMQFINEVSIVELNGKEGVVNKKGEEIIPCECDCIYYMQGLLNVCKNGKWGYYDLNGKVLVPCIFDAISWFINGLADVEIGGNIGVVDIRGRAYFQKEHIKTVRKYYKRITEAKTIIQKMIAYAKTEEGVLNALFEGKKHTNLLRTQMEMEIRGQAPEEQNGGKLEECKKRAEESIKLF